MNNIQLQVRDRSISLIEQPEPLIQGNVNVDSITATFSDEWDNLNISVTFGNTNLSKTYTLTYEDGLLIPWEVLAVAGKLLIMFTGYEGELLKLNTKPTINLLTVLPNLYCVLGK